MSILLAAAMCLTPPQLVGFPATPSKEDVAAVESAFKRCPKIFPKSPCVSKVERRSERNYHVVCGNGRRKRT